MKLAILILLGIGTVVLANGGGYRRGGVEAMGDVAGFEPENTEKVRIVDELLRFECHESFADVEVRYLMKNLTGRAVTVRFGFPVEESYDAGTDPGGSPAMKRPEGREDLLYCENYRIEAAGRAVKARWEPEPKPKRNPDVHEDWDVTRFDNIKGWLVSEVKFAGDEEKPVRISFRSRLPRTETGVSDDGHVEAVVFPYRLSTAAVWGGTIARGRIELVPVDIDPADLRVIKPVNRFRREGAKWVWEFQNLEPTLDDDLSIEVQPEEYSYGRSLGDWDDPTSHVSYRSRAGKWSMSHANYEVRASSTLADDGDISYSPAKVREWEGAWSEGVEGNGAGEWLELTPNVPKPLKAIEIVPGYDKSDDLFAANARPKRVEVLLNGEHRFEAEIEDAKGAQSIRVRGYDKPVKTVRLTFKEVHPGSRFDDLCVSGVRLEVALERKPEITPQR
ncbi:NADase-type glycan-binding domain-containing protein [Haloferula sp. A504]|uniref:NADase-type glycan-binding domain-containing protein n=1 Tax=Haloferula sp. A504 TaxID=3373601 RepID=UPI0031BFF6CF|nr:hypothetical protein [Verrucomicrobiaceae bacterium E54]